MFDKVLNTSLSIRIIMSSKLTMKTQHFLGQNSVLSLCDLVFLKWRGYILTEPILYHCCPLLQLFLVVCSNCCRILKSIEIYVNISTKWVKIYERIRSLTISSPVRNFFEIFWNVSFDTPWKYQSVFLVFLKRPP